MRNYYPMFMDIHVMIYFGYGLMYTFLKKNSWTAVGHNFMIASYAF